MITISVINESTVVSDADVQLFCDCQQMQVTRDFYPVWGIYAKIKFVPKGQTPAKGTWQAVILDTSDQADALGYHDLTSDSLPLAKIFAKTTMDDGGLWSVTASHEVLEMLADPWINLASFDDNSKFYAYEVCDAVEADELGYVIGKFHFSDFVFPAWFEPTTTAAGTQYSFKKNVSAPFQLAKGGYISYVDLNDVSKGWQQITAATKPHDSRRLNRRKVKFEDLQAFGCIRKPKKILGIF
jgi:hypothetical protein